MSIYYEAPGYSGSLNEEQVRKRGLPPRLRGLDERGNPQLLTFS
jgi:hypothetical protein